MSAIAGLEVEHGLDRDEFGGRDYAPRRLDPYLMEGAAPDPTAEGPRP